MSSITDSVSRGSEKVLSTSRDVALGALRGTGNLVKETGNIAEGTLKGATKFASNTIDRGASLADNILHGKIKGTVNASKNLVTGTIGEVVRDIEGSLQYGLGNKYVSTTIKVLIALYAAFAAPQLPKGVAQVFDSSLVRIAIAVLIVYLASKDSSMAILLALAFILTLQTANKYKLIDSSRSVSSPGHLSWLPSLHQGPPGNSHPESTEHFVDHEMSAEQIPLPHEQSGHMDEESIHSPTYAPAVGYHEATGEENVIHYAPDIYHDTSSEDHVQHEDSLLSPVDIQDSSDLGSNLVPGANQDSCVQTWKNQHCVQGLNNPQGFDETVFPYSQN